MQRMDLRRFRVTEFRSVEDSGWHDIDTVTGLIGTNEAGKSNLLIPLWKLNPAKGGEISPTADYPRKRFHEIRAMDEKPIFIHADFELDARLAGAIATTTGFDLDGVQIVRVTRDFDGEYTISFPNLNVPRSVQADEVKSLLNIAKGEIEAMTPMKSEESLKPALLAAIDSAAEACQGAAELDVDALLAAKESLEAPALDGAPKKSSIVPRYQRVLEQVDELIEKISKPLPATNEEVRKTVMRHMPSFVYYSNYGNLDSEIYLPQVIQNMERKDLGTKEEAKRRTLKVLFDFVKVDPKEILDLGKETPPESNPSPEDIAKTAKRKAERDILLQSAGTDLTSKFRAWWKQGKYRFRFQADGNHFRIWVSDDLRPEEIELEGRSSGLQWFLSFFLVFLVESEDSHAGAILLLDEPGLTLHPLAQEDLSAFFENLSHTNQLIYTTHSPFMIQGDHLDRIKAVFVGENGATLMSSDLRSPDARDSQKGRSIFAVHAALGLSVSKTLFPFSDAVIVEGFSDQLYLTAIKTHLIAQGLIRPPREMMFVPTGGAKGVRAVLPLLVASGERLPFVVHDSDKEGRTTAEILRKDLYSSDPTKLIGIGEFAELEDAEIEDIWPPEFLADIIARILRGPEESFSEVYKAGEPIVPQVEAYAAKHGIELVKPGWKVEVADRAKARLLREPGVVPADSKYAKTWRALFEKLIMR